MLANDLQADPAGHVRALMHITEGASGHGGALDGLYVAREEDAYALRFVATGVEDGFTLYTDPSGLHMVFGHVGYFAPSVATGYRGEIVSYRSEDGGVTWGPAVSAATFAVNPTVVEPRNGSLVGGPTDADAYLLRVAPDQRTPSLTKLRDNGAVLMAEPIDRPGQ